MTTVSIVFHTGKGHTGTLAEAIAKGAKSVEGVKVHLIQILPKQINVDGRWQDDEIMAKLNASDAIIFGCPTYMGSVSGIFKLFMEATFSLWFQQSWKDKFASGFTNSASQSGDKLSSLIQLMVFASQLSMNWISVGDPPGNNWSGGSVNDINRLGSWIGVMSQSDGDREADLAPPDSDRLTAERHGQRVASIAQHWKREGNHITEYITNAV
jgi:NAD(P)H dehydrogenase (quinone)